MNRVTGGAVARGRGYPLPLKYADPPRERGKKPYIHKKLISPRIGTIYIIETHRLGWTHARACQAVLTMYKRLAASIILAISALLFIPGCGSLGLGGWFSRMDEGSRIVRTAKKYQGVPYRYGGETPRGFDCSGYVMYVYKLNGILLPRSVRAQYRAGRPIGIRQARPGDLVFFRTSRKRRLSHVGIYMGDRRFIHAPRTGKRVTVADMRNPYWKKRYIGAVTFIRREMM